MKFGKKKIILGGAMGIILAGSIGVADLALWSKKFAGNNSVPATAEKKQVHIKTPETVKAIYLTSATPTISRFDELMKLVEDTELNAVVIDIKDSYGKVAYDSGIPLANAVGISKGKIRDLPAIIKTLHEKNIYAIARIAVFQDPALAHARKDLALQDAAGNLWADKKGVTWVDPAAREAWEYNAALAKEAEKMGFDEINFDYIRFATDGDISRIHYPFYDNKTPKWEVMKTFFSYLRAELGGMGVPISIDLFGITLWRDDDINIGQRLADALLYFDYVSPMLYPSHFPAGFEGWANPALRPYEIYQKSIARGMATRASTTAAVAKFRPWVQDFDLGADYTADMVRAEIKGAMDEGSTGWMLWNARNVYTSAALEKE